MPKYVFEVSAILPVGDDLKSREGLVLSAALAVYLKVMIEALGHPRCEVDQEPPFEHVYGDASQSIDLEVEIPA